MTVETNAEVEDLPRGQEESLPQRGNKSRRQAHDHEILVQQENLIETESIPKPERSKV